MMGPFRRPRREAARLLCGVLLALAASIAGAQEPQEINRLIRLGQLDAASTRVDALLARNPKDAQGRFLKGVVLSEQGKSAEAISVFLALTEDYPELPEPYNNLASLYAAKGQYEKAKTALEMAIQTNPAYGTAYENLGDVYARMASQAYDRALQLDKSNATAAAKLSAIRSAFAAGGKATGMTPPIPAAPAPATPAPAKADAPKPAAAAPATAAPPVAGPTRSAAPAAAPAVAAPAAAASAADGEAAVVLQTVNAWATAWSARNLDGYLGAYSKNFAPEGKSRAEWEAARRTSFPATRTVKVEIEQPQVSLLEGNQAQVTFHQHYRSDRASLNTKKLLLLSREDGAWHIAQEKVLP